MGAPARQLDPLPSPLRSPRPVRRTLPSRRPDHPARRRPRPVQKNAHRPVVRRTFNAVGHLPETSLVRSMVRRPPLWIFAISALAVLIVFINVAGISYSAQAGKLGTEIRKLERKSSILRSSQTKVMAMPRIRSQAAASGMAMPAPDQIRYVTYEPGDLDAAVARLAAEGG